MALINCPECNHEMSDQAHACPNCGYRISKRKNVTGNKKIDGKKIAILATVTIVFFIGLFFLYYFFSPRTVSWCCYHRIIQATCTTPEYCERCKKRMSEPLGHSWLEATCTSAKTCSVCGKTDGKANGHNWKAATCTEPKICKECGMIEGEPKGHQWVSATCTTPKTCTVCGKKEGTSLGHKMHEYVCIRCKESIVKFDDVPNILDITSLEYDVNYVGGIDQYMAFTNKSARRTIKYITIKLQFYNSVGDIIRDEISGNDYALLSYTGPIKPGKKSEKAYWRACFYNSSFSGSLRIAGILIEYSDESVITLDESIAMNAVKAWR